MDGENITSRALKERPIRGKLASSGNSHQHPLYMMPTELCVSKFSHEDVPSLSHSLLNLIMDTKSFLVITFAEDEISLVHPTGTSLSEARFTTGLSLGVEPWSCVQVGAVPLGFEETGIVASGSSALASASISIFYIYSFSFDYILVNAKLRAVALGLLRLRWDVIESLPPPLLEDVIEDGRGVYT